MIMKKISILILAGLLCPLLLLGADIDAAKERCQKITLKDQGLEREAWLYIPKTQGDTPLPLVVVLHGYGGLSLNGGLRFFDLADSAGFAVCWPQGAKDGKGKNCWNVGYPAQEGYRIDDGAFLKKLIKKLRKEYGVSGKNVFLTGMSNGGEMCYQMAVQHPELFSAFGSIAGLTLTCLDTQYTRPVPFLEVHGTEDRTSEWNGDPENKGGWGAYLAVPLAVGRIVAANRCVTEKLTRVPSFQGEVLLHRYEGGLPAWEGGPAADVLLYEVKGGNHSWSEKFIPTCDLVWDFFSRYLRPETK